MAGMKHGSWSHIEIPTGSVEQAKRFYGGVFGWKFTEMPEMKYTLYSAGEGEVGGGIFNPPPGIPRQVMNYVTVGDLDSAAAKIQELGGSMCSDRREVPGHGWFRIVKDPDGNSFAIWQSMRQPAPEPSGDHKKKGRGTKAPTRRKRR